MHWPLRLAGLVHLLGVAGAIAGCATTSVRGVVFIDTNGDGVRQPDERGHAGAIVAFERTTFATTAADGSYSLEAPDDFGRVWVRVPAGFRPGAVSTLIGPRADLPLVPLTAKEAASPFTIVVAADTHTPSGLGDPRWDAGDLADATQQATSLPDKPRFFTIVGDITQANDDIEFEKVSAALFGIVAITDQGSGDRGGLVALDLASGAQRWRYRTPFPAVGGAAIANGTIVVATKNGEVHAVGLDGKPRWRHDAGAGLSSFGTSLWSAPTIADNLVYVALQTNFTALDLATGVPVWSRDPDDPDYLWLGSLASVAVAEGNAIAAFNRTLGLKNWSATTGATRWSIVDSAVIDAAVQREYAVGVDPGDELSSTVAINASPVIDNGVIYMINAAGKVSAAQLATGAITWTRELTPTSMEWSYSVMATPAIANGRLFVATQWDDLVALDAASGAELWRAHAPAGPLNFTHYRSAQAGFPASPVVTGDIVWIGALDGRLLAYAADDGRLLWSTQLGAPVASAPAPTGNSLVIASYDGTVRLLGARSTAAAKVRARGSPEPPQPRRGRPTRARVRRWLSSNHPQRCEGAGFAAIRARAPPPPRPVMTRAHGVRYPDHRCAAVGS